MSNEPTDKHYLHSLLRTSPSLVRSQGPSACDDDVKTKSNVRRKRSCLLVAEVKGHGVIGCLGESFFYVSRDSVSVTDSVGLAVRLRSLLFNSVDLETKPSPFK